MAKSRPITPQRLEDVKITPEAWAMFEHAVDRGLRPPHPPAAKKAAKERKAKPRTQKGAKAS